MKNKQFSIRSLQAVILELLQSANRFVVVLFLLLLTAAYGYVLYRISALSSVQPSQDQISAQVKAADTPHVDSKVIQQLQALQDNSVNVQTLFNQARTNPFHE